MGLRIFLFSLFAECLSLLPGAARASIFSCPTLGLVADPSGAYRPPLPAVSLTNAVVSSNASTGAVIVCNYRTQLTATYNAVFLPPNSRPFCPQFTLSAVTFVGLVIPELNFSAWPYTTNKMVEPEMSWKFQHSDIGLPISIALCSIPNNGVINFLLSNTSTPGYYCSVSGNQFICYPPMNCPSSLIGSLITTTWPTPAPAAPNVDTSQFTYYPATSAIDNNGLTVVDTQSPSLPTLRTSIGADWNSTNKSNQFVLTYGCTPGSTTQGAYTPLGVNSCVYHSQAFQNNTREAVIVVATAGVCTTQ
jgi:hypothetical protein